ncbi:hypothetical protein DID80_03400 [Candidatus Marinamargulisbacteria bacterium SCGC AAA071-K20]|nr:hypothetical protein DID80_03400 [Candidatus Marinamargulisbacteria bacterium SCGC AAA071-K20]
MLGFFRQEKPILECQFGDYNKDDLVILAQALIQKRMYTFQVLNQENLIDELHYGSPTRFINNCDGDTFPNVSHEPHCSIGAGKQKL